VNVGASKKAIAKSRINWACGNSRLRESLSHETNSETPNSYFDINPNGKLNLIRMQTVLLLDDNIDTVSILKLQLEGAGFKVIPFSSCLAAMEFVAERPSDFDLVLSDLHMPDASGLDLLTALREIDPTTPFLIMTAQLDFDEGIVSELGGQGVIYKPLVESAVITRLKETLRQLDQR
jgi:DNA-binding NtrC family response regulator